MGGVRAWMSLSIGLKANCLPVFYGKLPGLASACSGNQPSLINESNTIFSGMPGRAAFFCPSKIERTQQARIYNSFAL